VTGVHLVVPGGVDDPLRPSGGNVYDRHVSRGLTATGWRVHEHAVPGRWPGADATARRGLADVLAGVPDGGLVLADGLVASAVPEVTVPAAHRLGLVVLVHMPLGEACPGAAPRERAVLAAAVSVVTTSRWTRQWLLDRYALPGARVHVAEPGAGPADVAPGSADGGELLCVGAVTPGKGHDVLLAALATVTDLPWRCAWAGALGLDPAFVDRLRRGAEESGIAGRLRFAGPLSADDLADAYAAADVLVLASRAETYGMVVTEALARGLPVLATAVGGVPEALGEAGDGSRPGLLVAPGSATAFAAALRAWLGDRDLRQRLRCSARRRRSTLSGWSETSSAVARVLSDLGARPDR